jgi:hypothetical protein
LTAGEWRAKAKNAEASVLGFWLLLILLILLTAALPVYPYSRGWGYVPLAIISVFLVIWMILIWLGWLALVWPWAGTPVPG